MTLIVILRGSSDGERKFVGRNFCSVVVVVCDSMCGHRPSMFHGRFRRACRMAGLRGMPDDRFGGYSGGKGESNGLCMLRCSGVGSR